MLALTALYIIAKIEETPIGIDKIIEASKIMRGVVCTQDALLELESRIVHEVDFTRLSTSPVPLVESFAQLYGLRDSTIANVMQVKMLAIQYCKFMFRGSCFLELKPTQIAAASLMLAINISQSILSKAVLNLEPIPPD